MLREVEGQESDDFLELYDYDIQYMATGGTETGCVSPLSFPLLHLRTLLHSHSYTLTHTLTLSHHNEETYLIMFSLHKNRFKPVLPFVQEPRMYRLHFTREKVHKSLDSEEIVERTIFNMTQVRLSALSLTKSDVFLIDGGSDGWLWQWNGSLAAKKYFFNLSLSLSLSLSLLGGGGRIEFLLVANL